MKQPHTGFGLVSVLPAGPAGPKESDYDVA